MSGDIPTRDIDELARYWKVCPTLKDALFADDKGNLLKAIKDLGKRTADNADEYGMLHRYKKLLDDEAALKADIKKALAEAELEIKILKQYPTLSLEEVKTLVVEKKWMRSLEERVRNEMENISHRLAQRIKELVERYETPLPQLEEDVNELTARVDEHSKRMGFF